jgi:hypothetical protein
MYLEHKNLQQNQWKELQMLQSAFPINVLLQCAEKIELLQRVAVCNNNSSREKKKLFQ